MYMKNAKTPTLILQGENDTTDPLGQSQQLYRGLKHYGVEAEIVVYPREPHGPQEEKHRLDILNRIRQAGTTKTEVAWTQATFAADVQLAPTAFDNPGLNS